MYNITYVIEPLLALGRLDYFTTYVWKMCCEQLLRPFFRNVVRVCQQEGLDFEDRVSSGTGAEHVTNCRLPSDNWRFPCFNRMCIVKISKMTKREERKKEKIFSYQAFRPWHTLWFLERTCHWKTWDRVIITITNYEHIIEIYVSNLAVHSWWSIRYQIEVSSSIYRKIIFLKDFKPVPSSWCSSLQFLVKVRVDAHSPELFKTS